MSAAGWFSRAASIVCCASSDFGRVWVFRCVWLSIVRRWRRPWKPQHTTLTVKNDSKVFNVRMRVHLGAVIVENEIKPFAVESHNTRRLTRHLKSHWKKNNTIKENTSSQLLAMLIFYVQLMHKHVLAIKDRRKKNRAKSVHFHFRRNETNENEKKNNNKS